MKPKTEKQCKCGTVFKVYKTTDKYCSYDCQKKYGKPANLQLKPLYKIPQKSKKRIIEEAKYSVLRIEFLSKIENKICPITQKPTTDIHHKKGRLGSLLLDTRYWVALSREGHRFVEENPIWAKENGYSLNRLSNESENL
jgi:hypothetical protein